MGLRGSPGQTLVDKAKLKRAIVPNFWWSKVVLDFTGGIFDDISAETPIADRLAHWQEDFHAFFLVRLR